MKTKRRAIKLLREILSASEEQKAEIIERVNEDAAARSALEYLEAKQLIQVNRAWGGAVYDLSPSSDGVTFFQDRADRRTERWVDRIVGFIVGVASTVLAQLIIQAIQAFQASKG